MATRGETFHATVFIAGDMQAAKQSLRRQAHAEGLCVTVTPTTFVYTGGAEEGVAVGFVNYPRFPTTKLALHELAKRTAQALIADLFQRTALVVGPEHTEWLVIAPPGAGQ